MGTTSSSHGSSSATMARSYPRSQSSRFYKIADNFSNLDQVVAALRREGLESSNLILAVDFTKSNEWTGKNSFQNRCLHQAASSGVVGPYEDVIRIIGKTLMQFDDDQLIPCYGFGDVLTQDSGVFSFFPDDQPAVGMDSAVNRYRELVPAVKLAGPTSFSPAIWNAIRIVSRSGNQFHILLIIADGQVTRPSDLPRGQLSKQESETVDAIVAASQYPLSIIMVGVGDGPWDTMQSFDDQLPTRTFDNFQFVNFTDVASRYGRTETQKETMFALRALMEVPEQFKLIQQLGMLGRSSSVTNSIQPLNPPPTGPPPAAYQASPSMNQYPSPYQAPQPMNPYPPPYQASPSMNQYPPAYQSSPSMKQYPTPAYPTPPSMNQYPPAFQTSPSLNQYPSMSAPAPPHGSAVVAEASYPAPSGPSAPPMQASPSPGASAPASETQAGTMERHAAQPDELYMCPITQWVMKDPVLAADGYTYERAAIERWFQGHDTSPLSNQRLDSKTLLPNHALRSAIMEWHQRTGQ